MRNSVNKLHENTALCTLVTLCGGVAARCGLQGLPLPDLLPVTLFCTILTLQMPIAHLPIAGSPSVLSRKTAVKSVAKISNVKHDCEMKRSSNYCFCWTYAEYFLQLDCPTKGDICVPELFDRYHEGFPEPGRRE